MSREDVYSEMKEMIGLVPGFFEAMPDDALVNEWELFKKYILVDNTTIPAKYRELIGVAIAAAGHCWYCSNFHAGTSKLNGATDEEIQEAIHLAKLGVGWSAYLNGSVYDRDRFLKELQDVGEYLTSKQ